jgi:hypothetical protein
MFLRRACPDHDLFFEAPVLTRHSPGGVKMKRLIIPTAIIALIVTVSPSASQPPGDFGMGIMLGEPTGFSGKLWLSSRSAVDGGIAWSFDGPDDGMQIHSDYLRHDFQLIHADEGAFGLYYGIGGRLEVNEHADDKLGLRIPIGLNYLFEGAPMDLFVEFAPIMNVTPDTDFEPSAAIGARYFFGRSSPSYH